MLLSFISWKKKKLFESNSNCIFFVYKKKYNKKNLTKFFKFKNKKGLKIKKGNYNFSCPTFLFRISSLNLYIYCNSDFISQNYDFFFPDIAMEKINCEI